MQQEIHGDSLSTVPRQCDSVLQEFHRRLPTAPRQCGGVLQEFHCPLPQGSEAVCKAPAGLRGTKVWAPRELQQHRQTERQGVPRAAMDRDRRTKGQTQPLRRCHSERAHAHTPARFAIPVSKTSRPLPHPTALHPTAPSRTSPHRTALRPTPAHPAPPHPTPPHSTPLHSTPPNSTPPHPTPSTPHHSTPLHCIALHCTPLHNTRLRRGPRHVRGVVCRQTPCGMGDACKEGYWTRHHASLQERQIPYTTAKKILLCTADCAFWFYLFCLGGLNLPPPRTAQGTKDSPGVDTAVGSMGSPRWVSRQSRALSVGVKTNAMYRSARYGRECSATSGSDCNSDRPIRMPPMNVIAPCALSQRSCVKRAPHC